MLKTILSISGKPGLFKLVSQGKNMLIAESLVDKKRIPVHARDKVISLGDIAMYTDDAEIPLYEVLTTIKEKENGAEIAFNPSTQTPDQLRAYLEEVLPNFDRDRVYPTDIKKLLNWYNLLVKNDLTDFTPQEEEKPEAEAEATEEATAEETKAPKAKAPAKAKEAKPQSKAKPKSTAPKAAVSNKAKAPAKKTSANVRKAQ